MVEESINIIAIVSASIAFISAIFTAVGLFITYKKNSNDRALERDKELIETAFLSLETAYKTLTADGNFPEPNRLNWITSAREIQRFKNLCSHVKTDQYQLILKVKEEHWRHKFYLALGIPKVISSSYYSDLHKESVLIIYDFSSWQNGQECPLDSLDFELLLANTSALKGNIGLSSFLKR
ncbi:MAG: hypothetical protein HRU20_25670 [Pseudomonadales bacterium]|nr:hypothetical protein [Pseudomonadales bacterium]